MSIPVVHNQPNCTCGTGSCSQLRPWAPLVAHHSHLPSTTHNCHIFSHYNGTTSPALTANSITTDATTVNCVSTRGLGQNTQFGAQQRKKKDNKRKGNTDMSGAYPPHRWQLVQHKPTYLRY
eukprot:TRINITY_DN67399_c3_g2_i1.p1 TRINITY_DN67399_c3_g2~~TRINITY_DN67399_c3_g2_i1.p1  ORF type:complete len:122 (-),score=16.05 TRINITY_DN67399_c3_g2_i1:51-416(-)